MMAALVHLESDHIQKHLTSILESGVSFREFDKNDEAEYEPAKDEALKLLNCVKLKITDGKNCSRLTNRFGRTFSYHFSRRLEKKVFSSQADLAQKCVDVAVSPDWILSQQGVYKWVHPKNVRYVDSYVEQKVFPDGSVLLMPLDKASKKQRKKSNCVTASSEHSEKGNIVVAHDVKRKRKRKRGQKKKDNSKG